MSTIVEVFAGEYDLTHQLSLQEDFDSLCDEPDVVLDLTAVTYLDSTFVNALLRPNTHRIERKMRPFSIVLHSLALKRLFSLLYLGVLFRLVDTLEEALLTNGRLSFFGMPGLATMRSRRASRCARLDGAYTVPLGN